VKKKTKIILIVLAVVLVIGIPVFLFVNAFYGNGISRLLCRRTAEQILRKERFADEGLKIANVNYNFKQNGTYFAYVESPTSIDTHFSIYTDSFGNYLDDDYDFLVQKGWNTAERLNMEYYDFCKPILENMGYNSSICFGEIMEAYEESEGERTYMADYPNDTVFDLAIMGGQSGKLTLYIDDENVSVERAAEILSDLKAYFDENNLCFATLDFALEYPKENEENPVRPDGTVTLLDFPYEDLEGEGLAERVRQNDERAKAYYAEKDAERAQEGYEEAAADE